MTRATALLLGLLAIPFETPQPTVDRPNVLLITLDHLRVDNIGANGAAWMRTPHLDSLAREGVSLRGAFINGIACSPSRASLFTGRYPRHHGVRTNGVPLPESAITLTHVLREAGYYTGQIGKLHLLPHSGDRNHRAPHPSYGFHELLIADEPGPYDDDYGRWLWAQGPEAREAGRAIMPADRTGFDYAPFPGDERLTHASWVASETTGFIRRNSSKRFFIHAGFYAPHPPLNPPKGHLARYADVRLPPRAFVAGELELLPKRYQQGGRKWASMPEQKWDDYRRHFYALVSHADDQIGRILDALRASGLTERTLVIVTSDHGDYLGDHGLNGKSPLVFDQVFNVPLIVRGPAVPARGPIAGLVELVDVMPTVLEMLRIAPPAGIKGESFRPLLDGRGSGRPVVYAEHPEMRMIRSAAAKYASHPDGEVLFDLKKDAGEHRNLARDPASKPLLDEMRGHLRAKEFALWDELPRRIAPY
jgi:arylsulfatase